MPKNRNTKRARLKLKQKQKNQPAAKAPNWNTLVEMNRDLLKCLVYLDTLGKKLLEDYRDKLESNLRAKETFKGYYRIIEDVSKAVAKLNLTHVEKNEDGTPKLTEKGAYIFLRGKCKNETEKEACLAIVFEYQQELMNIEPMIEQVLPDLVSVLGANKETQDAVEKLKGQLGNITSLATLDMAVLVQEYEKEMKKVSSLTSQLLETSPELAAGVGEATYGEAETVNVEVTENDKQQ